MKCFNGRWTKRTALGLAGMAMIWTATTAQAQSIIITVYPSQDNPDSETIWIFGSDGSSSTASQGSSIRSSQNFHIRDSWQLHRSAVFGVDFYAANKPTNQFFNLVPLFSSTNNPIDIESVTKRLPGGVRRNLLLNEAFPANDAPTIRIGDTSRTISSLFMNDTANFDEIGIRNTPPNLVFTNGQTSRWFGSGILNKPISDFYPTSITADYPNRQGAPYFADGISIGILGAIPEPEEYALVFGLFALAFVIVRRHFRKKGLN